MPKNNLKFKLILENQGFKKKIRDTFKSLKKEARKVKKTKVGSVISKSIDKIKSAVNRAKESLSGLHKRLKKIKNSKFFAPVLAGLALLTAGFTKLVQKANENFREYDKSIREISTLLDGELSEATKKAINNQSKMYGSDIQKNAKAYYDIVSAGYTDQEQALQILEQAQKSAIGGVTDVATAVDTLTSVMNTYKDENISVEEASDILFQTIKLGKTTFAELNGSIAQVLPIANQAGASFEEVGGAIALLTSKGVKTENAMTLLKGVFKSIFKQGTDQKKVLKELNLEWDTATLRTKGLSYMMQQLFEKTKGSAELLAQIVPDIRGLAGASVLAGTELAKFIKKMEESAGSTEEAFNKSKGAQFELDKAIQKTKESLRELGKETQILSILWEKLKNVAVISTTGIIKGFKWVGKWIGKGSSKLKNFISDLKILNKAGASDTFQPSFDIKNKLISDEKIEAFNREQERKQEEKEKEEASKREIARGLKKYKEDRLRNEKIQSDILEFKKTMSGALENLIKGALKLKDKLKEITDEIKRISAEKIKNLASIFKSLTSGERDHEKKSAFRGFLKSANVASSDKDLLTLSKSIESLYNNIDRNIRALDNNTDALEQAEKDLEFSKLFDKRDLKFLQQDLEGLKQRRIGVSDDSREALRLDKEIFRLSETIENLGSNEEDLKDKIENLKDTKEELEIQKKILESADKNANNIIQALKESGEKISASEIAQIINASMEGFELNQGLGKELFETLKNESERKITELNEEFRNKLNEMFQNNKKIQSIFGDNVGHMSIATRLFSESIKDFKKNNRIQIELNLKGELEKIITAQVERSIRAGTNNRRVFESN